MFLQFLGEQLIGASGDDLVAGLEGACCKPAPRQGMLERNLVALKLVISELTIDPGAPVKANHCVARDEHTRFFFAFELEEAFKRFVIPERIEDTHPSLQPAFRQLAEALAKVTWDTLLADRTLAFGSPDTVARHVEEMQQLGIGQILCWMNFGGLAQDKIRRSMELFAREVMPHFRDTARS